NAFETEFAFLLQHFHQLKTETDIVQKSEVIADFHLGKDLLYADLNLSDWRAKRLFGELNQLCTEKVPRPGLLIFLSATTKLLVERIRSRKRDFESKVDSKYCDAVNTAYEEFFKQHSGKKLRVPMDEWDFVKDPTLFEALSSLVDKELNAT